MLPAVAGDGAPRGVRRTSGVRFRLAAGVRPPALRSRSTAKREAVQALFERWAAERRRRTGEERRVTRLPDDAKVPAGRRAGSGGTGGGSTSGSRGTSCDSRHGRRAARGAAGRRHDAPGPRRRRRRLPRTRGGRPNCRSSRRSPSRRLCCLVGSRPGSCCGDPSARWSTRRRAPPGPSRRRRRQARADESPRLKRPSPVVRGCSPIRVRKVRRCEPLLHCRDDPRRDVLPAPVPRRVGRLRRARPQAVRARCAPPTSTSRPRPKSSPGLVPDRSTLADLLDVRDAPRRPRPAGGRSSPAACSIPAG